ncbi:pyridoxamine 5'-phosphate oxidase family protein [Geovibrio thiophilus]|uniref:Pyridoxamine 5'-phosphate oxidase family protein n=1 Tax=Geovibrio thiophilus TaxID=139438 RepID=A0A410JX71_9BACT|nr:pyridoxamine 5'-phosphate oxidase family protein [Geovibrio thiophilus]QAR32611.1 pyridoxamine 5'-phosphate oxidase family protein [Geovibrio thiophilus]
MLNETFLSVLKNEGVVSIVSWGIDEPHIVNTWNSYVNVTEDGRLLIPAAGMLSVESDLAVNGRVKLTLGSKSVQGLYAMGTGFRIDGTARFFESGAEFDMMKGKFPFLNRVLEISVSELKQTV